MAKRRLVVPTLFGLGLVLGLVLLRAADPYPVQALREIGFDFYQRSQPRAAGDFPVRVVDIDEASLTELGQWPWSRDRLATIIDRLTAMGAAAIAVDVLLAEPDRLSPTRIAESLEGMTVPAILPDYDAMLAEAVGRSPVVLGFSESPFSTALPAAPKAGTAISGANPVSAVPLLQGAVLPLPPLLEAAPGLGALSLSSSDNANVVRRLPLLWSDGTQFFPTLSVEALRLALGVSTLVVLGETEGAFVEALRIGDLTVPTMPDGALWIYYREPSPDLYVPAHAILAEDYADQAARIAGHIVFIGASASGLLDIHGTTLGHNVPGVSIHAQAVEQMLAGAYLTRTDWVSGLEIVGFAALGIILILAILGLGPVAGLVVGLASLGVALGFSWLMFSTQRVMIDPSFPLAGLVLVYAALVFFQYRRTEADRRELRRAFGHYVAPALLAEIERQGDRLRLGGEMRPLTVMFADVRGFTGLNEQLPPGRMLGVLNTLFGALGARIVEQMGTIDKFVGDAIMAFWNAPLDVPEHARRACTAALGMRETLRHLNGTDGFGLRQQGDGVGEISIGIGIASGDAVVGNMGLESRFDYSAIGDTVNTASRIEGACRAVAYDILVTEETRAAAADFAFLEAGALALKGKREREPAHLLVGPPELALRTDFVELGAEHARLLSALRQGGDVKSLIASCGLRGAAIDPRLPGFYERLLERRDDFADQLLEVAE